MGETRVMAGAILEASAIPIPSGTATADVALGRTETTSWGDDATGAGLATADVALSLTP
jgi:hypothetical protein